MPKKESDQPSPEELRATEIVQEVMRRRRAGEVVPDSEVLKAHPDLLRPLGDMLAKASAVAFVADEATESPWARLLENLDDEDLADDDPSTIGNDVIQAFRAAAAGELGIEHPSEPERNPLVEENPSTVGHNVVKSFQDAAAEERGREETRITFFEEESCGTTILESTDEVASPPAEEPQARHDQAQPPSRTIELHGLSQLAPTVRFRPEKRPPMALLTLRDDHQVDGESFRLREEETVIGRTQGKVLVPHDQQVSGRHASITREKYGERYRWMLRDLDSRNGVFVKIHRVRLKDQDLIMVANRLVQFTDPRPARPCQIQEIFDGRFATILELEATQDYWIGRDQHCCVDFLSGEPQVDPVHAKLQCDAQGRWTLQNCESVNGVWIRIQEMELVHRAGFQLGEQRFVFELA